ncbi:Atrial natriuretic peptide receptor 2 [Plakobranchus ocellatus]|uniref:Atrial natriuretic peptide receptor 2 n=1 Tax=Plakobranchus ocellatus TaxID=259542 RepID=A0AAV4ALT0_9GAST|nr:Atrial natriuretic peptide receptor 2 [Plakobranchus ocellatus]
MCAIEQKEKKSREVCRGQEARQSSEGGEKNEKEEEGDHGRRGGKGEKKEEGGKATWERERRREEKQGSHYLTRLSSKSCPQAIDL